MLFCQLFQVDASIVRAMSDEQLPQYLPKHGDRVAVFEYCSNKNKRKESSLQK